MLKVMSQLSDNRRATGQIERVRGKEREREPKREPVHN